MSIQGLATNTIPGIEVQSTLPTQTGNPELDKLFNKGKTLVQKERYDKAAETFANILRQKPDHFAAIEQLGMIAAKMKDFDRALIFFKALTEHIPTYIQGYGYAAQILMELESYQEAISFLNKALIIKDDIAFAHAGLGTCYIYLGDNEKSENHYRKALMLDSNSVEILYSYLTFHHKFESAKDPHLEHVIKIVTDVKQKLSLKERAALYTIIYKAYDDIGDFDKAFEYANLAAQERLKDNPNNYEETEIIFSNIKNYFSKNYFKENKPSNTSSQIPVFILAMPRTGTTLLETILSAHPNIVGIEEDRHFAKLVQNHLQLPPYNDVEYPLRLSPLKGEVMDIETLAETHLSYLKHRAKGAERIVDKAIIHYSWAGLLYLAFPNAYFIHMTRDPLSSGLSCYTRNFINNTHPYTNDLYDLGRTFKLHYEMMEHWKKVIPAPILDVSYETLVEDTENEAKRIIDFIGLDWDENCLNFHKTKKIVKTASAQQVRKPIYTSSLKTWQKYENHLAPLVKGLGPYAPAESHYILEKYGDNN